MHPARIAELLQPFLWDPSDRRLPLGRTELNEGTNQPLYQDISMYIDLLLHWNDRINLTAIRDPEEIVTRHFGESLFAARHLFPKGEPGDSAGDQRPATNNRVADLGSGAGFPGVPIKLWVPDITLTLIESSHKKATFLRELTRQLTLTNVNIQNVRADKLPPASFDVVTQRAVESFTEILPVAANLVAPSGSLALLIGSSQLDQARRAIPDLFWQEPISVPRSQTRCLLIGRVESR